MDEGETLVCERQHKNSLHTYINTNGPKKFAQLCLGPHSDGAAVAVPKYALGVQDIAFNVDGSQLAVGVRNCWGHSEDTLFILFGRGLECVGAATVWERTRRGKVRGCGDGERGGSEHRRGGQRGHWEFLRSYLRWVPSHQG